MTFEIILTNGEITSRKNTKVHLMNWLNDCTRILINEWASPRGGFNSVGFNFQFVFLKTSCLLF